MRHIELFFNTLQITENVEKFVNSYTVISFPWEKIEFVNWIDMWINSLFNLAQKNPEQIGRREPFLFILSDKMIFENPKLVKFIENLEKEVNNLEFGAQTKRKKNEWLVKLPIIKMKIMEWAALSQNFFELSIKDLEAMSERPNATTFFFLIREFHPRKIIGKHPLNESQMRSLEELSTKDILLSAEDDPFIGHRYFLPGDTGPATGIGLKTSHHRVYELYRRYINGSLENTCINEHCNGDIRVKFTEEW